MRSTFFRARDLLGRSSQLSVAMVLVPATFGGVALAIYTLIYLGLLLEPGLPMVAAIAAIMAFGFWAGRSMGVSMDVFAVAVILWITITVVTMSVIFFFL